MSEKTQKSITIAADAKEGWIGCNELWLLELVNIGVLVILTCLTPKSSGFVLPARKIISSASASEVGQQNVERCPKLGVLTVVVLSFVRSFILFTALQRAALTSSRQLRYEQAKHVDGLQSDSWILLKCFRSRVMAGSP